MEKRIGTITLLIRDRSQAAIINDTLSSCGEIILSRQGLPFHDRPVAVIVVIVEGTSDQINALTGRLGRIAGVESKAVLTRAQ